MSAFVVARATPASPRHAAPPACTGRGFKFRKTPTSGTAPSSSVKNFLGRARPRNQGGNQGIQEMSADVETSAAPASWGGKRKGAGRKKKVREIGVVSALAAPVPDEIDGVAQKHAATALQALVNLLR